MIFGTEEYNQLLVDIIHGKRHDLYEDTEDHACEMSVHIFGEKPEELLTRARPREDPEVTQYRLDNWEPITKSSADKAITIYSKIFNPNLYSIRWKTPNDNTKKLQEFILEYYPEHNSIVNFNKDVVLPKMFADPNAVQAVKPVRIPAKQTEAAEPTVVIYASCNVWY